MRYKILTYIVASFFFTACGNYYTKNGELIDKVSARKIKDYLIENNLIKPNTKVYGLSIYQLLYATKNEKNQDINTSAIVVLPSSYGANDISKISINNIKSLGYSVVIDNHSTIFDNSKSPSISTYEGNIKPSAILFSATNGFITLIPDYIGFGIDETHYHPYLLKNISAQNTKDLLKAFSKFSNKHKLNIEFNRALYMFGYSEGAYVSLASLEKLNKNGYRVSLTVIGAGAYLLDNLALKMIHSKNPEAILFIANTIYAYSKRYEDIKLKDIIKPKYLTNFKKAFQNKNDKEQILKLLPKDILGNKGLLRDDFDIKNSTLFKHLKENNLKDLKINNSVRLLHCKSDNLIPYEISKQEMQNLQENGATVKLNSIEKFTENYTMTHQECGISAYLIAAKMFKQLRLLLQGY